LTLKGELGMHPILAQLGPFAIRWYGAMIATACWVGLWLAGREAERKGIDKEKIREFVIYAILGGDCFDAELEKKTAHTDKKLIISILLINNEIGK